MFDFSNRIRWNERFDRSLGGFTQYTGRFSGPGIPVVAPAIRISRVFSDRCHTQCQTVGCGQVPVGTTEIYRMGGGGLIQIPARRMTAFLEALVIATALPGELGLTFWLLIKGVDDDAWNTLERRAA